MGGKNARFNLLVVPLWIIANVGSGIITCYITRSGRKLEPRDTGRRQTGQQRRGREGGEHGDVLELATSRPRDALHQHRECNQPVI